MSGATKAAKNLQNRYLVQDYNLITMIILLHFLNDSRDTLTCFLRVPNVMFSCKILKYSIVRL